MNNSINNVSFGAHLVLNNKSLDKHVSVDVANKFAQKTKNIPGFLTLSKNPNPELISANYRGMSFDMVKKCFYNSSEEQKVNTLERVLKYIREEIKFWKKLDSTKQETEAFVAKAQKIAGKDPAMFIEANTVDCLLDSFKY